MLILLIVLVSAAQYYSVSNNSVPVTIDEHSVCKKVTNSGSADLFVPTNTAGEWSAFRSNLPSGVSLSECGFTYTLTEGSGGGNHGMWLGTPLYGSINPTTYEGYQIYGLYSIDYSSYSRFSLSIYHYPSSHLPQDFFTSIKPCASCSTFYSNNVYGYSYDGYRTRWIWQISGAGTEIYDGSGTSTVTIA